jgi:hypothetical protein
MVAEVLHSLITRQGRSNFVTRTFEFSRSFHKDVLILDQDHKDGRITRTVESQGRSNQTRTFEPEFESDKDVGTRDRIRHRTRDRIRQGPTLACFSVSSLVLTASHEHSVLSPFLDLCPLPVLANLFHFASWLISFTLRLG